MIDQNKLEKEAKAMGATYFGVADLSLTYQRAITQYEKRLVSKYPVAVSIRVPLSSSAVDRISD